METHKVCARCKELRPAEEFGTKPGRKGYPSRDKRYLKAYCGRCRRIKTVAKRLGLDPDVYEARLKAFDGYCEICGDKATLAHLDHDHRTGAVRGFVCIRCNTNVLPLLEDFPELIEAAKLYLKRYGSSD